MGDIGDGTLDLNGCSPTVAGLEVGSGRTPANQKIGNSSDSADSVLTVNNTAPVTFAGTIQDHDALGHGTKKVALTKVGDGTLTLTGANSYTGVTTISGGVLQVGNGGTNGTLGTGNVTDNASLVFNRSDALTVGNVISGSGSLTKQGTGTLTLTGANTYGGATAIQNGVLAIAGGNDRLPTGTTVTLGNGGDSGKLQLGDGATSRNQTLAGLLVSGSGAENRVVGGGSTEATLTLNLSGDGAFNGILGGNGTNENKLGLTKTGAGELTLGGTGANTNAGDTRIHAGRLVVGKASAIRGGGGIGCLEVNGTLNLKNYDISVNALFGSGTITSTENAQITFKTNCDGTPGSFSGVIGEEAGTINLIKWGGVVQTFSGSNTYKGSTTVAAGTLEVNGSLSSSSTATVSVNSGGTLAGTGSVNRPVSVASGATLSPGGTNVGTLTVGYSSGTGVSFASTTSIFRVDIDSDTSYDKLVVNGTVALGSSTLSLDGTYTVLDGTSLTIIENDGTDGNGTFINASPITFYGVPLTINYAGGTGNDVVLSHSNLQAASYGSGSDSAADLTQADLQPIIAEAIARWAAAGLDAATVARLSQVQFLIDDLDGCCLGKVEDDQIYLDLDAAGYGWFVDATPTSDEEYAPLPSTGQLQAIDPRALDRIDLLTVVEHELGHIAGFDDLDASADNVMAGILSAGIRRSC
jgi:autotransporter-associated beta strand protein